MADTSICISQMFATYLASLPRTNLTTAKQQQKPDQIVLIVYSIINRVVFGRCFHPLMPELFV